jgi:hypothetical protein
LGDLFGGEDVDDVLADGGHVARGSGADLLPAGRGETGVGGAGVLRAREAFDQAAILQALHDV